jgi:phosphotransferase system enzyme I (PtsP)
MAHGVHVHHRGDRGVDGILRLIELAGHDGPIETMLAAMCVEIAAIAGVDIASVYVRERDDLVMRGNHGFSTTALGTTLSVGEGITGLVAECMRPVSAANAASEVAFKAVDGLGEERFPVFVGVPLIGGGTAIGVLVLQRRGEETFTTTEITLAMALGAPVTLAIERRRMAAVRSARLTGTVLASGGAVLGRANVVPTATAIEDIQPADIERALNKLQGELGRAIKKLVDAPPEVGASLDRLALVLCDARLRERLLSGDGLRAVAKDYLRAGIRYGAAGATDIEELCVVLGASLRPGAIWIADRVGAFVAIAAVARGASAIVASGAFDPVAIEIARAAHLPIVSDIAGLFGWARPGDLLAVDGDAGVVLVHPAQAEIEKLRASRA